MQSPNPEFTELMVPPGAGRGDARQMSSAFLKNVPGKSISIGESFAVLLANNEAAHQEWREKVQRLREASLKTAT